MSGKGIASNPIIHKFASSKGGKRKVKKGFGALDPETRKQVAAKGGKAKAEKYSVKKIGANKIMRTYMED